MKKIRKNYRDQTLLIPYAVDSKERETGARGRDKLTPHPNDETKCLCGLRLEHKASEFNTFCDDFSKKLLRTEPG